MRTHFDIIVISCWIVALNVRNRICRRHSSGTIYLIDIQVLQVGVFSFKCFSAFVFFDCINVISEVAVD